MEEKSRKEVVQIEGREGYWKLVDEQDRAVR